MIACSCLRAVEITDFVMALDMLGANGFKDREAASKYLETLVVREDQLARLELVAEGADPEAAERAASALAWHVYGLRSKAPNEAKAALAEYIALDPDAGKDVRIAAVQKIEASAGLDLFDSRRLWFMEARGVGYEGDELQQLVKILCGFYEGKGNPITDEEQETFWQTARELPPADFFPLLRRLGTRHLWFKEAGLKRRDGRELEQLVDILSEGYESGDDPFTHDEKRKFWAIARDLPPKDFFPLLRRYGSKHWWFEEAGLKRHEGDELKQLVDMLSRVYDNKDDPFTSEEKKTFWGVARDLPSPEFFPLLQRLADFEIQTEMLLAEEEPCELERYRVWGRSVDALGPPSRSPYADLREHEADLIAVFEMLFEKSPKYLPELAETNPEGVFGAAGLMKRLGVPTEKLPFLLRQYVVPQNSRGGMPIEVARVLTFWNDPNLAGDILEEAIDENDPESIRAFAYQLWFTGQLEAWIGTYQRRIKANPGVRNRRVLAHLLRADERWDEAFSALSEKDGEYPLYLTLAVETGNWEKALHVIRAGGEGGEPADLLRYFLRSAFLCRKLGREGDYSDNLAKAMAVEKPEKQGEYDDFDFHRICGLLVLLEPELAFRTCVETGKADYAFLILTQQYRYGEAFDFAMESAGDVKNRVAAEKAAAYFSKKCPEKAERLRQELALFSPQNEVRHNSESKASPDFREASELIRVLEESGKISSQEEVHLIEIAARPGNDAMRMRIMKIRRKMARKQLTTTDLIPIFDAMQDWEAAAEEFFLDWQNYRHDGNLLHWSGFYLAKAGQVEEGNRRMQIAAFIGMYDYPELLMRHFRHNDRDGVNRVRMSRGFPLAHHLDEEGFPTHFSYREYLRDFHDEFVDLGRRGQATLLWSAADFTDLDGRSSLSFYFGLANGAQIEEDLGMIALQEGDIAEAERRLAEERRLSIERRELGAALLQHHRDAEQEGEARRIYVTLRDRIQGYLFEMPEDKRLHWKLSEWRRVTGYRD